MNKNHFKLAFHLSFVCLGVALSQSVFADDTAATAAQQASAPQANGQKLPDLPIPEYPGLPPVKEKAFDNMTESVIPMSPEQIKEGRRLLDDMERAASELPRFVPVQQTRMQVVDLRPGSAGPIVRLWPGYVTALAFVDETGSPVNVMDFSQSKIGGRDMFSVVGATAKEEAKTHILRLSPNTTYARGNLSVILDGLPTPLSITCVSGQRYVDDRVDLRVRGLNVPMTAVVLPSDADNDLIPVLSGVAPDGAEVLQTTSDFVAAWKKGGYLYLRIEGLLMTPAPLSTRLSADGTQAAKIPLTSKAIVSISGVRTMIGIKGL